jgi:hypothetical protein
VVEGEIAVKPKKGGAATGVAPGGPKSWRMKVSNSTVFADETQEQEERFPEFVALDSAARHAPLGYVSVPIANRPMTLVVKGEPYTYDAKKPICPWKGIDVGEEASRQRFTDQLQRVKRSNYSARDIGIGILTAESGVTVIDLDTKYLVAQDPRTDVDDETKHQDAARKLLSDLLKKAGINKNLAAWVEHIMEMPHVRTPSGGYHYYFRTPKGARPRKGESHIVKNIDIRAGWIDESGKRQSGALAYAPGTVTDVGTYRAVRYENEGFVEDDTLPAVAELEELPTFFVALFEPPPKAKGSGATNSQRSSSHDDEEDSLPLNGNQPPASIQKRQRKRKKLKALAVKAATTTDARMRAYAERALYNELRVVAETKEGKRNSRLNDAAFKIGTLVGAGVIDEALARAALEEAGHMCGADGVAGTVDSGLIAGMAQPRDLSKKKLNGASGGNEDDQTGDADEDDACELAVIDNATGEPVFATPAIVWPKCGDKGPTKHSANMKHLLGTLGVSVYKNTFTGRYHIEYFGNFDELNDEAINALFIKANDLGLRWSLEFFSACLFEFARRRERHPVREYLDPLKWDGNKRLNNWLHTYLGAEHNEYNAYVGTITLLGAVRRVRRPGCKFDPVLVLEGPQGNLKSSAIECLASSQFYTDNLELGLDAKRVIEQTAGAWIVEISELGARYRDQANAIKAMVSRARDRARMSYGRTASDVSRQFIMIGTTNEGDDDGYLIDPTGNRRFWPVKTGTIDIVALQRDRDQLWAEAAQAEPSIKGNLTLPRRLWSVAAKEQEARRIISPQEDQLEDAIDGVARGFVRLETLYVIIGLGDRAEMSRRASKHKALIKRVMRRHGWSEHRLKDGNRPRGFCKDQPAPQLILVNDRLVPVEAKPPKKLAGK